MIILWYIMIYYIDTSVYLQQTTLILWSHWFGTRLQPIESPLPPKGVEGPGSVWDLPDPWENFGPEVGDLAPEPKIQKLLQFATWPPLFAKKQPKKSAVVGISPFLRPQKNCHLGHPHLHPHGYGSIF